GEYDHATYVIESAIREFEDLAEPGDWSGAHQKLALAHRGRGEFDRALRYIDSSRDSGATDTPMAQVRLDTAQGHILLSDTATRDDGVRLLDRAAEIASRRGLDHQLRSIEGIRSKEETWSNGQRRNSWWTTHVPSPRSSGPGLFLGPDAFDTAKLVVETAPGRDLVHCSWVMVRAN